MDANDLVGRTGWEGSSRRLDVDLGSSAPEAALDSGRRFARFRFWMQQAWFFPAVREDARRAAEELALCVRRAADRTHADALEAQVRRISDALLEAACGEGLAEEAFAAQEDLSSAYPTGDPCSARQGLLETVFSRLERLRSEVAGSLGEGEGKAFRLGEQIEEGRCRRDIYRFLGEDPAILAEVARGPGEVAPEEGWARILAARWGELGLPADQLPDGLHERGRAAGDDLRAGVEELAERAKAGLRTLVSPAAADPPSRPVEEGAGGAEGEESAPPVVLGGPNDCPRVRGKLKCLLTRPQYDVVRALLEAKDAGLTGASLDSASHHEDARKILQRLALDPDWASVIHFPGKSWNGGYRIG